MPTYIDIIHFYYMTLKGLKDEMPTETWQKIEEYQDAFWIQELSAN